MKTLTNFDLKLPFRHPVDGGLDDLFEMETTKYYHANLQPSDISDTFRNWASSVGMYIAGAEVFVFPENFAMEIHVDGNEFSNKHKINWTYSSGDHSLRWYKPNDKWSGRQTAYPQDDGNLDDYRTPWSWVRQGCYAFEPDEVDVLASTFVKGNGTRLCTVINSGIPHGIISHAPRISISATLFPIGVTSPHKDWGFDINKAYEIYKDYVVEGSELWIDQFYS